jgi:flagellar basal body-associated protein FliL
MADDDEKPEDSSEEAPKKGSMGPLLALVGVFALGMMLVFGLWSVVAGGGPPDDENAQDENEVQRPLLEKANLLELGDIMANVQGEQGRRYAKVTVGLWYPKEFSSDMGEPEILNIIIQACETRLASFDLKELNSEFARTTIARAFEDSIDKELRSVFATEGTDNTYVERLVLTNLLIQ